MARYRSHSVEFKRQVAQEYLAGEMPHGLAKRHDIARNLIQEYEARIAALERLVGKQALELEFLKGVLKCAPRPRSGTTFVVTGPAASPSRKDAD